MQTVAVEKTQTKTRRTSIQRVEVEERQTFQDWLAEEAAAGRMILAIGNGKFKFPDKPKETIDFWPIYNEVRADRF